MYKRIDDCKIPVSTQFEINTSLQSTIHPLRDFMVIKARRLVFLYGELMKDREIKQKWFPFWVDKWIWGSMRINFTPEERAIWVDLLCLASKDNGYIRANEETPYLTKQLAGFLVVDEETLQIAIDKFIKKKKLTRQKNGVLKVVTWDKYQLSERHMRRAEDKMSEDSDMVSEEKDIASEKSDSNINNNKDSNKDKKSKKSSRKFSNAHLETAKLLEKKIKERMPRYKIRGKQYLKDWANEFRLMEERDNVAQKDIRKLIFWIFDKSDFWYKNILSADKLREKFGRLWEEMKPTKGQEDINVKYKGKQNE